jgi:hypothetical protein
MDMRHKEEAQRKQSPETTPDEHRERVDSTIDHGIDEKALVRKLDTHLVPVVMGLYLLSFLDRQVNSCFTR